MVNIFRILEVGWWLILPLFLLFVFLDFWLKMVRRVFILKIPWKLLEIKIPREILKTPKAMEQVFAAVHSIKTKIRFFDKWRKGKVQNWMSFELTGQAGGVHFYVRTPEEFRNLTESAIYAQYPDAEIIEVEDYVDLLPSVLPNKIYDLWGANYILAKEDAYPIRTYEYFEERVKEKRLDPMAAVTEALSKTKEDEMGWLQILVRPIDDDWKKEGEKLIGKLTGRKSARDRTLLEDLEEFIINLIKAPFTPPVWSDGEEGSKGEVGSLTPGEKDVVAAMENKISKLGFEAIVRFVYIDKAASFSRDNVAAVTGALQQFNTQNLNAFKSHPTTATKTFQPFKEHKLYYRKRKIFDDYRLRKFPSPLKLKKIPILNTEELATIYHPPTTFVEAPTLRRLESRRGEPPAGLPILE
jgi:hypothetical protein